LLAAIKPALEPALDKFDADHPTHRESTLILAQAGDGESLGVIKSWVEGKKKAGDDHLIRAWEVLMLQSDGGTAMKLARGVIPVSAGKLGHAARGEFIARLGIRSEDDVAVLMLKEYDRLEPNNKGRAIQLMTERPRWAEAYVAKVEEGKLPPTSANLNQIRRLQGYGDQAFKDRVTKIWGRIRSDRNPQRDLVVSQMRNFLARTPGDPFAGKSVFEKQCAQCHKIYGAGQEIGPELTSNGRNDYEQLLSNVFDPNLVIGENYQAVLISTKDGRTLTGLLTENSDEEVRIKIQGGTEEVFPKDQVDEIQRSTISLMPENIESLVTPQELADLFAYLALDRPPGDPQAKLLPGAPEPKRRAEGGGD
jgi:putative heme-binding domain-containing protein